MPPKADIFVNSVKPNKRGVCTICPDLSVSKHTVENCGSSQFGRKKRCTETVVKFQVFWNDCRRKGLSRRNEQTFCMRADRKLCSVAS